MNTSRLLQLTQQMHGNERVHIQLSRADPLDGKTPPEVIIKIQEKRPDFGDDERKDRAWSRNQAHGLVLAILGSLSAAVVDQLLILLLEAKASSIKTSLL